VAGSRDRLSPVSFLAFLAWSLLLVALLPNTDLWLLLSTVVAFGWFSGGSGLRALAHPRFWLFVLSILALSPFLLGEADIRWAGLQLSRAGLETGLWMALRAATLTLAFNISLGTLSVAQMIRLFDQAGLRGLGFALGVALNIGPALLDVVESAYHTLRLRGGFRRPIHNARLFLVTVIANSLRYGDDIVMAASTRAFDPAARSTSGTCAMNRPDWAFLVGLATVGTGLLLL
jgi:energy-coupling factor transporter transmembrane protein EcfT